MAEKANHRHSPLLHLGQTVVVIVMVVTTQLLKIYVILGLQNEASNIWSYFMILCRNGR